MLPLQAIPALGQFDGIVMDGLAFLVGFLALYSSADTVCSRRSIERCRPATTRSNFASSQRQSGIVVLLVALAIEFTLAGYGAVLSALAILGGALALAIGFAAQDLVANVVAGVFILRDKPFVVGDWIKWDDRRGEVVEIDLGVTRIRSFDNELVTVPNSALANNAIINPVTNGMLRLRETFGIGYDDDINLAREILVEETRSHPDILSEPEPTVRLVEFGDSAVCLDARVWIRDPTASTAGRVRSEYAEAIKGRFDAAGIDMAYPHTKLTGGIDVAETGHADIEASAD